MKDVLITISLKGDQASIDIIGETDEIEEVMAHAMIVSKKFEEIMLNALRHYSEQVKDKQPEIKQSN